MIQDNFAMLVGITVILIAFFLHQKARKNSPISKNKLNWCFILTITLQFFVVYIEKEADYGTFGIILYNVSLIYFYVIFGVILSPMKKIKNESDDINSVEP